MNRFASRLLSFLMIFSGAAGIATAQTAHADGGHTTAVCGTAIMEAQRGPYMTPEEVRRSNPEEYRRLMEQSKASSSASRIASDDDIIDFFTVDAGSGNYKTVTAKLVFYGQYMRLWIDVADTVRVKKADILRVSRALDTATDPRSRNPNNGIVKNNVELFGKEPTDVALDEGTDFLLTNLANPGVLGYFSPGDQLPKTENLHSNARNLLYVDDKEGFANMEVLLSTIAHEHQHLIHYGRNQASRSASRSDLTIYNEGLAELASILNGYYDRGITTYMANPNVDIFRYTRDDLGKQNADYERATNFLLYLHEQFGEKFTYDIVGLGDVGMLRINSALELSGYNLSQFDWRQVMRNYTVANYVKVPPEGHPEWGIRHTKFQTTKVTPVATYTTTGFPPSSFVDLQRYGSAYYVYNNPGVFNYRYSANHPAQVMAIYYKDNVFWGAEPLEPDRDYELGHWNGPFSRIVLGVVGLANESVTVNWTAAPVTLGIAEEMSAASGLRIAPLSPNPVRDEAIIHFTAASGAEEILLELYDARGERVSTLFEGRGIAGGMSVGFDASALSSGVYLLRLRQGDRMVTRSVIVSK